MEKYFKSEHKILLRVMPCIKERNGNMSSEDQKIMEQISHILVREKQISSEEQLRMLDLIRKERKTDDL